MSPYVSKQKVNKALQSGNSGEWQPLICERWMTQKLHIVKPLDSVAHARALIEEYRINQLPVVENDELVGIVTDRDLRDAVASATAPGELANVLDEPVSHLPERIPVEAVMTRNVITLAPHSALIDSAELMRRERIGSVPIVDGGRLVGIVTRSDILSAFVANENWQSLIRRAATTKQGWKT